MPKPSLKRKYKRYKKRAPSGVKKVPKSKVYVRGDPAVRASATKRPPSNKLVTWVMPYGRLPTRLRFLHMYHDRFVDSPASYGARYAYKVNSLYDPDHTGTGIQPTMYDILRYLYDQYKVYRCKMSVTVTNNTSVRAICGLSYLDDAGSLLSMDQIKLRSNVSMTLQPNGDDGCTGTLVVDIPFSRLIGRQKFGDSTFTGAPGSDPSDPIYGCIDYYNLDGTTNINFDVEVVLYMYTIWSSPQLDRNVQG